MPVWLQNKDTGVTLHLVVQPRASKTEIVGEQGEELKVRLTSPPVEGAANRLCCEYFAKLFALPKGAVSLESGEKSRHKRIFVRGVTLDEANQILCTELTRDK